jgi:opacity protein-like surface antigen
MHSRPVTGYVLVILGFVISGTASAQQPALGGRQLSGIVGVSTFDGHIADAEAITAGYRFNQIFGFEIGAERVPGLRFSESEDGSLALWVPTSSNNGRALLFTGNAVATIPVDLFGLSPYVLAGPGMANLQQSVRFATSSQVHGLAIDRSQNVLALSFGGGVEYPLWRRRLAVGLDVICTCSANHLRRFCTIGTRFQSRSIQCISGHVSRIASDTSRNSIQKRPGCSLQRVAANA